ncbi:hypothetical protein [Streptomyces lincolnensis]|uniref:hypothetical protein n=1 Tax=Streptomyces lincolnensis TaxID=1915 RepID=UPI001E572F23|nr:hypothetical protein [Streptomyces lincolnensis]
MSENHNEPREAPEPAAGQIGEAGQVGQVGPVEFTAPATPTAGSPAAAPPVKNPARRRRIATAAGSVLLAGAVVAGVGFTAVAVNGADRDAGDTVWKFPKPTADAEKAPTAEGLAGLLVPYGTDGWVRGPDLGAYGSDAQLSGAQATALRKESLSALPRTQRKRLEKQIDRQKLTGMAMRSYLSGQPYALDNNDGIYTVSIVLAQMESRAAVKNISTFQQEFLDALDVFRKGPEIKGHKNAECFLPPKDADTDLDSVFCSAYQGDVLVTATADGVKPIDAKGVAMLLSEQLDRISEPGEAV